MGFLTKKNLLILSVVLLLLAAIPLTLYLVQQQQEIRSRASASTAICFALPSENTCLTTPLQKSVNEETTLDVLVLPSGSNSILSVQLDITYDQEKIATATATTREGKESAIVPNSEYFPIVFSEEYQPGRIAAVIRTAPSDLRDINTPTTIASITFKPIQSTSGTPTAISFGSETVITSASSTDIDPESNILSGTTPASLLISASTTSPTTTASPTTPATTETPTPTLVASNLPPKCNSLNVDRTPSGTAPFSIALTANGDDPDGTISKVSFNFGDGPVQDMTEAGGIGTNSISTQVTHTYNNPGTYTASAILTDNAGATSNTTTCTQTITVTDPSTAGGTIDGSGIGDNIGGVTTQATATPVIEPTIEAPGPGEVLLGVGALGIILSVLGGILFFAL